MTRILDKTAVRQMTSLSMPTLWRMERAGRFPQRVRLSGGRVGWFATEVEEWLQNRPRGIGTARATRQS